MPSSWDVRRTVTWWELMAATTITMGRSGPTAVPQPSSPEAMPLWGPITDTSGPCRCHRTLTWQQQGNITHMLDFMCSLVPFRSPRFFLFPTLVYYPTLSFVFDHPWLLSINWFFTFTHPPLVIDLPRTCNLAGKCIQLGVTFSFRTSRSCTCHNPILIFNVSNVYVIN